MKAISQQLVKKFSTDEDYKVLYSHIKMYCLVDELYNSDSISFEQKRKQHQDIVGRYVNLKKNMTSQDIQNFIKYYDIEKEFKKIESHQQHHEGKLELIVIRLTQKAIQTQDLIGSYEDRLMKVSQIVNHLLQLSMLLNNYKNARKTINQAFKQVIDNIRSKYEEIQKQSTMSVVSKNDLEIINDLIIQMRHHISNYANGSV